jgi:hypothetical protein
LQVISVRDTYVSSRERCLGIACWRLARVLHEELGGVLFVSEARQCSPERSLSSRTFRFTEQRFQPTCTVSHQE